MLELGRQIGGKITEFKERVSLSKDEAIYSWEKEASELFGGFRAARGKDDGSPVDFKITSHLGEKVVSYIVNREKCKVAFPDTEDSPFDYPFMQENIARKLEGRLDCKYMMLQEKRLLCNNGPFTILVGIPLGQ